MTPAPLISNFYAVRHAAFLWVWLTTYAQPANQRWQVVAHGEPMSDERIACHLDVSAGMVRRWRMRLEKLGYIRTELARPRHRRYFLVNLSVEPAVEPAPAEHQRVN